jgi:hypothetical protein
MGARRGRQDDDRVMPQVDPVRALADPSQRPHPDDRAEPGCRMRQRQQQERREDRQDEEPTAVEELRVLAGLPEHVEDRGEPDHPRQIDHVSRTERDARAQVAARPDCRERGSDQELLRPRVGSVIDPRGIEGGVVEDSHEDRRDDREADDDRPQPGADPAGVRKLADEARPDQQQERPEDVELLLDRQRPQVVEGARRGELGEVRDVVEDQPPVVDVGDGAQELGSEIGRLVGPDDRDPGHHDDEHHEQRRQQPPRPRQPERLQPDAALRDLAEQDVGDQVAAQREEDAHTEQAAGRPTEVEVIGDHAEYGDRTQAVEARHVARLFALYRLRHTRATQRC